MTGVAEWREEQLTAIGETCDKHKIPTEDGARSISPAERVGLLSEKLCALLDSNQ